MIILLKYLLRIQYKHHESKFHYIDECIFCYMKPKQIESIKWLKR